MKWRPLKLKSRQEGVRKERDKQAFYFFKRGKQPKERGRECLSLMKLKGNNSSLIHLRVRE
jgi:hypothetical protein